MSWSHLFDEISIVSFSLLLPIIRVTRITFFGQKDSEKWDLPNLLVVDAFRGAHIVPMLFVIALGSITGAKIFGYNIFSPDQTAAAVERLWLFITLSGILGLLHFKADFWTVIELKDPAKKKKRKARKGR